MAVQNDGQLDMGLFDSEVIENFVEEQQRTEEENKDVADAVIPPPDIVAFNEQRSCADIYRMYEKGQLDINPEFQRGEVWTPRAQTLFVDSLMKQLPIPSMCICLDINTQKRIVIDGLQRISTIVKFLKPKSSWKLSDVEDVDPRIANKTVADIKNNAPSLYETLENLSIPITVLRCDLSKKEHMEYLFQIFYRLNSGGNKLYNQEIRNCIYSGPFNNLLKQLAISPAWLEYSDKTEKQVLSGRFANEERILRFFAFYSAYNEYKGRLAGFLNNYMNDNRFLNETEIGTFAGLFERTLHIINPYISSIVYISKSKNLTDALLVGVAKNISILETKSSDVLEAMFRDLTAEPEFAEDSVKEDLGGTSKVKNRIEKAIEVFSRG